MVAFLDQMVAESGEVLRGNRFKMQIDFPAILGVPDASLRSEFNCVSTEAPSPTIGTLEVPLYGGHKLKIPGTKVIPDWSTSMMLDGDMVVYRALAKWIEIIDSVKTGLRVPDIAIFGGATLRLLGALDDTKQTWKMKYIFPTEAGSIALSKEDADAYIPNDISWVINDIETDLV